jgi:lipopolysaccharide export system protein LptC
MIFRIFTLLAVLAVAVSIWILGTPGYNKTSTQNSAEKSELPGYYLKNAVLTDFDAGGTPGIRVDAERIDQVDHGNEVQLSNVKVEYQAPGGQTWEMVGDTAHVQPGGKVVDVAGNVRLEGAPSASDPTPAIMHADTMSYDVANGIATSKGDVRIDFGKHVQTAHGLTANLKDQTIRLESKVHGRFQP